jgi:hypothetical protein
VALNPRVRSGVLPAGATRQDVLAIRVSGIKILLHPLGADAHYLANLPRIHPAGCNVPNQPAHCFHPGPSQFHARIKIARHYKHTTPVSDSITRIIFRKRTTVPVLRLLFPPPGELQFVLSEVQFLLSEVQFL